MREQSLFEQLGGTYHEGADGLLYPDISLSEGEKDTESQDVLRKSSFSGKYGDIWKNYMKENYPDRYRHLLRFGILHKAALAVNEEANELLDVIMEKHLAANKPENPASTIEMWKIREQAKHTAEEEIYESILYQYHES